MEGRGSEKITHATLFSKARGIVISMLPLALPCATRNHPPYFVWERGQMTSPKA